MVETRFESHALGDSQSEGETWGGEQIVVSRVGQKIDDCPKSHAASSCQVDIVLGNGVIRAFEGVCHGLSGFVLTLNISISVNLSNRVGQEFQVIFVGPLFEDSYLYSGEMVGSPIERLSFS